MSKSALLQKGRLLLNRWCVFRLKSMQPFSQEQSSNCKHILIIDDEYVASGATSLKGFSWQILWQHPTGSIISISHVTYSLLQQ